MERFGLLLEVPREPGEVGEYFDVEGRGGRVEGREGGVEGAGGGVAAWAARGEVGEREEEAVAIDKDLGVRVFRLRS